MKQLWLNFIAIVVILFGFSESVAEHHTPNASSIKRRVSRVKNEASGKTAKIFLPFAFWQKNENQPFRKTTPNNNNPLPLQLQEFLFDTTFIFGPVPDDQEFADISFDGTNYFIVWHDWRNNDIYGTRVSSSGVLLDSLGIPICTAWAWQLYPSIAFDGTNYLVVWEDWRNGDADIYGARVTPAGIVLDPDGFPISAAEYDQIIPSIEFDGTNYLVAWNDFRNGLYESDIYAARVTPNGVVLDPNGIPVSTAPYEQMITLRGIAFDGTNYLLVWHDDRDGNYYYDIYGARLTQAGTVLDPDGFPISQALNNQGFAQVGFDGTNYLVVWLDDRSVQEDYRIYGARVTPSGIVLDPQGIQITQYLSVYPALDFDGSNYLVVWTDIRSGLEADIYGARVTTAGIVLDPEGIPISTAESDQWMSAILFDGTNYFTTWSDYRNGSSDIYGARLTTAGIVLEPEGILLDYGYYSPEQNFSAVSFDGTNYFAVWTDYRNGDADIYGARVTPSGIVLDPQGIPIATAQEDQFAPALAFDGTNYLVVWQDWRNREADIYGTRVTPSGIVLDPQGIAISTAIYHQYPPDVAFDGINYLVVWDDGRSGEDYNIYGARVTPDGIILDPNGIPISTADYDQYFPSVAFGDSNYLVVWWDNRSGEDWDVYGARVTPAGIVLDPDGFPISAAEYDQIMPSIEFDGTNYLVAWNDFRNGLYESDIYAARVTPNGVVLDPQGIPIATAPEAQTAPALTFDGTNYLVVWEDWRNWGADIYGAHVTPAGIVLNPQGIELINQPDDRYLPQIVKGQGPQLLLTFTGYVSLYGVEKILGAFYPSPGIIEIGGRRFGIYALKIYPNPAKSMMRVLVSFGGATSQLRPSAVGNPWTKKEEISIKIFDISGKLVKEIAPSAFKFCNDKLGEIKISLKGINPGTYFLRLGKETKKFSVVR